MSQDKTLFVISCGGHGTRFASGHDNLRQKVLYPLDPGKRCTSLEYNLRALPLGSWIGLAAGEYRESIEAYARSHSYFGHDPERTIWIPEHYQSAAGNASLSGVPDFPLGAAAWLLLDEPFIETLERKGIEIIVQTAGNKVGWRMKVLDALLSKVRSSATGWVAGVYELDDQARFTDFDFVCGNQVLLKGYDTPRGKALAYWYGMRVPVVRHLWNDKVRAGVLERARGFRQRRCWRDSSDVAHELEILDINFPLILGHVPFETVECGTREDWGIELRTPADVERCWVLFDKREREGEVRIES